MKSELLLKHYLKKLKLPTILREYRSIADNCAKDNVSYSEFLLRLFEREENLLTGKNGQLREE
jgi:hypothetical protein